MGTPEFAVPALEALHARYGVQAVVTVPDKPKGRGLKLLPSDVKIKAEELGIEVLQPVSLKSDEFAEQMREIAPDIIVVIAFRILPVSIYSMAKIATFNIHGSLLPKFRGAAPINWAVISGETETGLTAFKLAEKVDTGSIIDTVKVEITPDKTFGDLYFELEKLSAELALNTCEKLLAGNFDLLPQKDELASAAPKLFADGCFVDWNKPNSEVRNFIHGTSPVPGARTIWNEKLLKIYRAKAVDKDFGLPGDYRINSDGFLVQCATGSLQLVEIQPEGKKALPAVDFLRGYRGASEGKMWMQ
jgi:methionyl-tRNA formyltransferase